MELTRRRFLGLGAGAAMAGATLPLLSPSRLLEALAAGGAPAGTHKLLVMFLSGGNDGLNTVVPYGIGTYYSKRPTIAIPASKVLTLPGTTQLGLHPNLVNLQSLYNKNQVALMLGAGYDNPDLSHFASTDIWMTGSPTHAYGTGWLGRWLDLSADNGSAIRAVSVGYYMPLLLMGDTKQGVVVPGPFGFAFADGRDNVTTSHAYRMHSAWSRSATPATTPTDPIVAAEERGTRTTVQAVRDVQSLGATATHDPYTLADQVTYAVSLLDSTLGVDIAFVDIGGFDDHNAENPNHDARLKDVDNAIGAFSSAVAATTHPADFMMMTFSEFGRRVDEDGSAGTDHGTAAPHFVIGPSVKGGMYGQQPALDTANLDPYGNMKRQIEFREIYITVLDKWLQGATSAQVLNHTAGDGLNPVAFL
jgi:uncharacterized protein (DUF1501 family)